MKASPEYSMRTHCVLLAIAFLGLGNSFLAPAPVSYLRAPCSSASRKRFRSVSYISREADRFIAADDVQDDIRAAQRRFKGVARNAEVNFYGQALPGGIVSFSLIINVLFALDTAVTKDLPFVSNDSTEAVVRALYAGVPAFIAGAFIEVWRLQRLEESANKCAAKAQADLEALFLLCESAELVNTSTVADASIARVESLENNDDTSSSNVEGEARGGNAGSGRATTATAAAAKSLKARMLADAAVSDPPATIRIILAAAAPLSLLAGALGNIGFGERAISDWMDNGNENTDGVRSSRASSRGGSSKSGEKSSSGSSVSGSPSSSSSIDDSLKTLVLVVGTCAASCFLHGGLQRGLAQFFGRLANRAAVAWYPSDLALEAADATAPLADFTKFDSATGGAATSAAMTTPLLFSPFSGGSSFAPWAGGGADDATLVAHAWPVFAALPLVAAPAAAAITALATFACDRGLILAQRPGWAQTRAAQDEALAAAAARGPSYFAVADGVPAERANRRSVALRSLVDARAIATTESDNACTTAAAGRATLGAWAFALSGGSALAPALSYLGAELAPWCILTFLSVVANQEEEEAPLEGEIAGALEEGTVQRDEALEPTPTKQGPPSNNASKGAQRRGDSL